MMFRAVMISAALALAACASGPRVQSLSDPSLNMAQYRTFGFAEPLGTDRQGYQTVVSTQLKASTRRELEARGLSYAASDPDLLVNFGGKLDDKLRVSQVSDPMMGMSMGYYGYRGGFYQPWPMYSSRTEVSQYREGTLTIDMIDARRKQLVWEGTVTDTVKDNMDIARAIDTAVTVAIAKLPR